MNNCCIWEKHVLTPLKKRSFKKQLEYEIVQMRRERLIQKFYEEFYYKKKYGDNFIHFTQCLRDDIIIK